MLRPTLLATSLLFLLGCASARTSDLVHNSYDVRASAPSLDAEQPGTTVTLGDGPAQPEAALTEPAPAPSTLSAIPPEGESLHSSRFTIKGGYYSAEDADELDDGYILNASWMRYFSKLLAIELEVGYLDTDGEDGGVEADVYGIPIMVNGRANIPVWILDLYGGLGVGTIYYDAEVSGGLSAEEDGFLLGGNVFLGATINLADRIALGLEAKYYQTEEIDDVDATLEAFALMLTLGFSR